MKEADIKAWQDEMFRAFSVDGMIGGAVLIPLFDQEQKAGANFIDKMKGHRILTDCFLDFFGGSFLSVANATQTRGWPNLPNYSIVFLMFQTVFRTLRAAEIVSLSGYFYQAYSQLRSVKDQAVALTAVANEYETIANLFGVPNELDKKLDHSVIIKNRMAAEKKAEAFVFGVRSGLSTNAIAEIVGWNQMFNWEAHRGLMTFYDGMEGLIVRKDPSALALIPPETEMATAMFMNRSNEVSWMILRLLPFLQTEQFVFGGEWISRWKLLDRSFRMMLDGLSEMGKTHAAPFIEMIDAKFNFDPSNRFREP